MHGAVHDYVVLKTIKDGRHFHTAEEHGGSLVCSYADYPHEAPEVQPIYKRILDIGALNICGSQQTYDYLGKGPLWRDQVGCEEYVGLDLMAGPCVTLVANSHNMPLESNYFDLVICLSMLEHDSEWGRTIYEAHRVLKKGQPFVLTTVNKDWGDHAELGGGDTETYNHFTKEMIEYALHTNGFRQIEAIEWRKNLFYYSIKEF